MASVVVTLKIMPKYTKTNLKLLENKAKEIISKFGGDIGKTEINSIAFGIKSLNFIFVMDESKGSTEILEKNLSKINGVSSVEIMDVRRAIG